ncbi:MAG: hypothetical protein ACF8MJ_06485 [Phycisphaerales bacterium JB050]
MSEDGPPDALPETPAKPANPIPMFCLNCYHDLGGVPIEEGKGFCPECGKPFDTATPSTYARRRRSPLELLLLRRIAPGISITLLIFTLLWYGWIPRPVALFGRAGPAPAGVYFPEKSSLWMWAGSLYGTETVRLNRSVAETWFWKTRIRRVRVFDPGTGDQLWEVEFKPDRSRPGGGVWSMRVVRPVPLAYDLLGSFRLTRERILGLAVGEYDPRVIVEPFEVTGSEADILSAYIRATGIPVTPIRSERDQLVFWIFDDELERLIQVDSAELDRRGIVPVDRIGIAVPGIMSSP